MQQPSTSDPEMDPNQRRERIAALLAKAVIRRRLSENTAKTLAAPTNHRLSSRPTAGSL